MAKTRKSRGNTTRRRGKGPPEPKDYTAFGDWLTKQPREWSVIIASRAALRVLPLISRAESIVLPAFRAAAIARFAAKYPNGAIAAAARAAAREARGHSDFAAYAASSAADAAAAAADSSFDSAYAAKAAYAADAAAHAAASLYSVVKLDALELYGNAVTAEQLARNQLWPVAASDEVVESWQRLRTELSALGHHWQVWIDWYQNVVLQQPYREMDEAEDAAFTDIPGELPWDDGVEAVNIEIARRLSELSRAAALSKIPDQSLAPVRVEERDGRISRSTNRDSAFSATERDFRAWREPVIDHIDELKASDFAAGTNHSRIRDRLMALGKLLPGEIAEVKDQQFRIGYEIERFEGLMAAYRLGGEDMPMLNAAQLEDLDRLRVALKMGIDKLERWSEFRRQANESAAGEVDADRQVVSDALDEMAVVMEQRPQFFDPQLPATFRFLSEAVRDPSGATKAVIYGAIKSAENVVSFLGQRALGIGKKGVEAVETHISKGVATLLIGSLGTAALGLSGALPQGWAWLKPLLAALGAGG